MKAIILNSGIGSRMGVLTSEHPKCMTEIGPGETILSRQLRQIADAGIKDVVITTGRFDDILVNYCNSLELSIHITFVKNPIYAETNYIYSIYCAREYLDDDIILMHGDIVFENVNIKLGENNLLENINLKIKQGQNIAVIGDNGVRKNSFSQNAIRFL